MLHLNMEKNECKPPQVREQIIKRCSEEMRKNTPKEILYKAKAGNYDNLILCGRLANYKYYNMDQAILAVLRLT